jgi:hypothetical protein
VIKGTKSFEFENYGEEEITIAIDGELCTLWVMRSKTATGRHFSVLGYSGCEATLLSDGWPEEWDDKPILIAVDNLDM